MAENNKEKDTKLSLGGKGTLSLKGGTGAGSRPNLAGGNRGAVVEVRRNRSVRPSDQSPEGALQSGGDAPGADGLTSGEKEARAKALRESLSSPTNRRAPVSSRDEAGNYRSSIKRNEPDARQKELEELQRIEALERPSGAESPRGPRPELLRRPPLDDETSDSYRDRMKKAPAKAPRTSDKRRDGAKLTVTQVLNEDYERDRGPSLAAQRRAREKARKAMSGPKEQQKVYREVTIPETITVQDLSNRMTERSGDVIKALMRMGVMATINQVIDADTAELIAQEFGHSIRRVSEADIETGLEGIVDTDENLLPRAPVVTIMGHVDHGKTSLLDAIRATDVAAGEAGGITQHIGAYQITMPTGKKITFLDTPGHAAFTEMRARGANVTDIVVLVVAADDSVMPQTVEAISHAKAAKVPIIVAINKVDLPNANPRKIKQDLLSHEIVVEEMGGDVLTVEVSAKKKMNLDKLEEIILLQAEVLELRANPSRPAQGAVVEAKMEPGRGSVATILVQKGTLRVGDIFVVGSEWGRVRALLDDRGNPLLEAGPGMPVEIIGLTGTPNAGDSLNVVEDEAKARQVSSYRLRKKREKQALAVNAGRSLETMLAAAKDGEKKILPVLVKADVHGSAEAIVGSLMKMTEENKEIGIQVLHSGVGAITESDITLAKASRALVIGFNVRANAQARDMAHKDGVDIRYYNIIYNVIDDAKALLSGLLSPSRREEYLGQAAIRQVFNISKIGKVAGCMVTTGVVKRGSGVRLLRDNVVIHEGTLKTLKRFKDEVKEVKEGMECGMAFEKYDDIREGDVIECYDIIEEARTFSG